MLFNRKIDDLGYELDLRAITPDERPRQIVRPGHLRYRSYEAAKKIIYPEISRRTDRTVISDGYSAREWTQRFLEAAFQTPNDLSDSFGTMEVAWWNQLQQNLIQRLNSRYRPYSLEMIEARFSLLFPIALALRNGGQTFVS